MRAIGAIRMLFSKASAVVGGKKTNERLVCDATESNTPDPLEFIFFYFYFFFFFSFLPGRTANSAHLNLAAQLVDRSAVVVA